MKKDYAWVKEIEIGKYYGKTTISIQEVLRIFLETSRKHTRNLESSSDKNVVWMLYRWNVNVEIYPSTGDIVNVETKIVYVDKLYAYRKFSMIKDNVIIARGMAQMVLVNKVKRQISIIPERLRIESLRKNIIVGSMKFPKFKILENPIEFDFQYRDIDENNHMNNIAYFDYLLEYMIFQGKINFAVNEIASANITYSKEISYPAKFKVSTKSGNKIHQFTISDNDDNDIHASGTIELK